MPPTDRKTAKGTWVEPLPNGGFRGRWRFQGKKGSGDVQATWLAAALEAESELEKLHNGQQQFSKQLTWGRWYEEWWPRRHMAKSYRATRQTVVEKWVLPHWTDVRLVTITRLNVVEWLERIEKDGATLETRRTAYVQFAKSMVDAVEREKIKESPCHNITLPKAKKSPGIAFTPEQVHAIVTALKEPYATAVVLLAYLGLRIGELSGLHWANVYEHGDGTDERPFIWVAHTWLREHTVREMKPIPKGREGRRVYLPAIVADRIVRPVDWQRPCGAVHEDGVCPGQLVVTGPFGKVLDGGNMLNRHFRPAMQKAGIDPRRWDARNHDLRHTLATWLLQAGRPMTEVAAILGDTVRVVEKTYAHVPVEANAGSVAALNGLAADSQKQRPALRVIRGSA